MNGWLDGWLVGQSDDWMDVGMDIGMEWLVIKMNNFRSCMKFCNNRFQYSGVCYIVDVDEIFV